MSAEAVQVFLDRLEIEPRIDGTAAYLLLYLCWRYDVNCNAARVSQARMMRDLKLVRSTLKEAIKRLEDRRLVRKAVGRGSGNVTYYELPWLKIAAIQADGPIRIGEKRVGGPTLSEDPESESYPQKRAGGPTLSEDPELESYPHYPQKRAGGPTLSEMAKGSVDRHKRVGGPAIKGSVDRPLKEEKMKKAGGDPERAAGQDEMTAREKALEISGANRRRRSRIEGQREMPVHQVVAEGQPQPPIPEEPPESKSTRAGGNHDEGRPERTRVAGEGS